MNAQKKIVMQDNHIIQIFKCITCQKSAFANDCQPNPSTPYENEINSASYYLLNTIGIHDTDMFTLYNVQQ